MDAFGIRNKMIDGYRSFSEGFVDIQDRRIAEKVEEQSSQARQWPDPWLSLNPSFKSGGSIDELVARGLLHEECRRVFRVKNSLDDHGARELTLHQHQADAVKIARSRQSYVPPYIWNTNRRLALRAEIDALLFIMYEIDKETANYIMDSFPIVRRHEETKYGEFLTKRLVLDDLDAMKQAIDRGVPYESPISPLPGYGERHSIEGVI